MAMVATHLPVPTLILTLLAVLPFSFRHWLRWPTTGWPEGVYTNPTNVQNEIVDDQEQVCLEIDIRFGVHVAID